MFSVLQCQSSYTRALIPSDARTQRCTVTDVDSIPSSELVPLLRQPDRHREPANPLASAWSWLAAPAAVCIDFGRRRPAETAAVAEESWKRRQAAFPIWRIAFYRHLDDRSAVGPIIDIGRFYRAHRRRGALTRVANAVHGTRVHVSRKTTPNDVRLRSD